MIPTRRMVVLVTVLFVGGCYTEMEMREVCTVALAIADDVADSLVVYSRANDCANMVPPRP